MPIGDVVCRRNRPYTHYSSVKCLTTIPIPLKHTSRLGGPPTLPIGHAIVRGTDTSTGVCSYYERSHLLFPRALLLEWPRTSAAEYFCSYNCAVLSMISQNITDDLCHKAIRFTHRVTSACDVARSLLVVGKGIAVHAAQALITLSSRHVHGAVRPAVTVTPLIGNVYEKEHARDGMTCKGRNDV